MVKKNKGKTSPIKTPAPHEITYKRTPKGTKWEPSIIIHKVTPEYPIFARNPTLFLFFIKLCARTKNKSWVDRIDMMQIRLGPFQGTFKAVLFRRSMGLDKTTIWRYMRTLIKYKFLHRTIHQSFSIYTLTGKGVILFESEGVNPVGNTPERLALTPKRPQVKRLILLKKKEYSLMQSRILKHSPCARLDDGLPRDLFTWLTSGICVRAKHNCKLARNNCLPDIKILVNKIQNRRDPAPIKHPKAYCEKSLNEYFYQSEIKDYK